MDWGPCTLSASRIDKETAHIERFGGRDLRVEQGTLMRAVVRGINYIKSTRRARAPMWAAASVNDGPGGAARGPTLGVT